MAIQVLAGTETVSELARQHEVSRKFLYQQVHTAEKALSEAFAPSSRPDDVLFYLPVTKAWLRQLVLGLAYVAQVAVEIPRISRESRRHGSWVFTTKCGLG